MGEATALSANAGGTPAAPMPLGGDNRAQIDRASITVHESKPAVGGAALGAQLDKIDFQFNPKELTIAKTAKWERKPAKSAQKAAPPEFKGAEPCKLTLEMFFDASGKHDGSVVAVVEKLFNCCVPSSDKPTASPPLVQFHWGPIKSFPAFITSVSAKYTVFASDGTPIRAVCTVSLEEMPGGKGKQNPTSGSLTTKKVHRMVSGDTLASMAYREYGDATRWRELAEFNDIDDPLRIGSGYTLLLPDAEELTRAEG
ncbi:hypothetical protein SAMN04515671_4517 [Nakamurella panacisegetis]|uniref:LysM domain-containing protein n=1 Tax=Nakamurella panacisegetis TaxID=1090615 RepID=A0A1H0T9I9_9ACTN|nr:LysM peptidoglycan-binding domain-containing protein [Nakamurella panacisegetis]SDP50166.1 hypothetical protein SAMN04515671_4517 [Nakamurella panacisegetis]